MAETAPPRRPSYDPQALLNAQPVMVAVIDPATYTVQFQNETGIKQLGDLSGRPCYETIAGCPAPCAFCKMPEAVRTGAVTMNEVALPNKQHLLVQWSKAVTDDGRTHVIETITDVTAQKRLEEAAHRAEKMEALSRLAGGTAHDINNLLTVIAGASELVSRRREGRESTYDPIKQIQHAVGRVSELMCRFIAIGHGQVVQAATLDLNAVLTGLESRIRTRSGPGIAVTWALTAERLPIVADPRQIEQIVMTLIDNACEAMIDGGQLTVATRSAELDAQAAEERKVKPGRFVRLDVCDTGRGIDPGTQAHLFEPYFTRTGLMTGRGLGLASVYGMVRQCGGSIDVASQLHVGSRFSVWVPSSEHSVVSPAAQPAGSDGAGTILLVEDDDDVRLAVGDMLKGAGYHVQEACDGMDAVRQLDGMAAAPRLAITDVVMPRMTGPQFVKHLHAAMPATKVLFMSGYAGQSLDSIGDQPVVFIQKPFSAHELIRKVREILSG
jgi:signal transduction histidine kinase